MRQSWRDAWLDVAERMDGARESFRTGDGICSFIRLSEHYYAMMDCIHAAVRYDEDPEAIPAYAHASVDAIAVDYLGAGYDAVDFRILACMIFAQMTKGERPN